MISTMRRTIARGRVELAALLHLLHGEFAHQILVDPPEGVAFDVDGIEES